MEYDLEVRTLYLVQAFDGGEHKKQFLIQISIPQPASLYKNG